MACEVSLLVDRVLCYNTRSVIVAIGRRVLVRTYIHAPDGHCKSLHIANAAETG